MIKLNDCEIEYIIFSGGEVHINDDNITEKISTVAKGGYPFFQIDTIITNSSDLMALLILKDMIDRFNIESLPVFLNMPYLPYARQDRINCPGEGFSLKVFANIINSCNFTAIEVFDCHSDVGIALIDRSYNVTIDTIIEQFLESFKGYDYLVCPDAGARKKFIKIQSVLNKSVLYCDKIRNTQTGEITGTKIDTEHLGLNEKLLIIDDICDGGATFTNIAKKYKEDLGGHVNIDLFVTHGIFSKGLSVFEDFDKIITTDSLGNKKDPNCEFAARNDRYLNKLEVIEL